MTEPAAGHVLVPGRWACVCGWVAPFGQSARRAFDQHLVDSIERPDIRALIEASSLGTPEAVAARASVTDEQVSRVMARVRAIRAAEHPDFTPAFEGDAPCPWCPDQPEETP